MILHSLTAAIILALGDEKDNQQKGRREKPPTAATGGRVMKTATMMDCGCELILL